MKTKYVYPYNGFSKSARGLAREVNGSVIRREGSRFRPHPLKTIINWGCAAMPEEYLNTCRVLNHPACVKVAANKLKTLVALSEWDVRVPEYTTLTDIAMDWVHDGDIVFCRTVLNGRGGEGIVIADRVDEVVPAPLYTKYVKKKSEFRVHVSGMDVMMVQQKVKRADLPPEDMNWMIRNHENGYIYQQNGINPNPDIINQSLRAVAALSLDFGAVDVIWNDKKGEATVLEVNTAPGLEGETLKTYGLYLGRV